MVNIDANLCLKSVLTPNRQSNHKEPILFLPKHNPFLRFWCARFFDQNYKGAALFRNLGELGFDRGVVFETKISLFKIFNLFLNVFLIFELKGATAAGAGTTDVWGAAGSAGAYGAAGAYSSAYAGGDYAGTTPFTGTYP